MYETKGKDWIYIEKRINIIIFHMNMNMKHFSLYYKPAFDQCYKNNMLEFVMCIVLGVNKIISFVWNHLKYLFDIW